MSYFFFFVSSCHIVTQCDTYHGCHTCFLCHTCHKYLCYVALVNKCVIARRPFSNLLNVIKVWGGGAKSDSKAFGRLLRSRPKAKMKVLDLEAVIQEMYDVLLCDQHVLSYERSCHYIPLAFKTL
jgi:hypothetical protein